MALLATIPGAFVTQSWGKSWLSVEPEMYTSTDKAYWLQYPGGTYTENFHPGIDRSAPYGAPIVAMEAGVVEFSGWKDAVSGNQVEIAINEQGSFSVNHMSLRNVFVGQSVLKGQLIGHVGTSGLGVTGPHAHEGVSIYEKGSDGISRTFLYNPALFLAGGKFANDPRMQPEARYLRVNGPGVEIRYAPPEFDSREDVFALARGDKGPEGSGIYRRSTNNKLVSLEYRFKFFRWRDTMDGEYAIVGGMKRRLAIKKDRCHFV